MQLESVMIIAAVDKFSPALDRHLSLFTAGPVSFANNEHSGLISDQDYDHQGQMIYNGYEILSVTHALNIMV